MKLAKIYAVCATLLVGVSACSPNNNNKVDTATETAAQTSAASRPNILFIMSDDHAERAISAYGSDLTQTPNIDRIADTGVRFDNAFVTNSICGPSRAVLMTGKHSHLNGFRDNAEHTIFDGSQQTFPKLLQQAGYQTGIIGKWHLGSDPTGFDHWQVLIGQGEYYSPQFKSAEGVKEYTGEYVTNTITDLVLDFIENRDADKPFALMYHHKAPHRNWMPDVELLDKNKAHKHYPLPASFNDDYVNRVAAAHQDMRIADMYLGWDMKLQPGQYEMETGTGGYKREAVFDPSKAEKRWQYHYNRMNAEQKAKWDDYYQFIESQYNELKDKPAQLAEWMYQRYMHDYLATVESVDNNIGRVLDRLEQQGLLENTIVVYTSDQGFYLGEHGWFDKRFMYEESMSTPLLISYPKLIKQKSVKTELVQNLDFAPTLLDLAGVEVPADMQGLSMKPLLLGDNTQPWRDSLYYQYFEYPVPHAVMPHYGIRTSRYKLIHFTAEPAFWELYDLQEDPNELHNIYNDPENKRLVTKLTAQLADLRSQYQVPAE